MMGQWLAQGTKDIGSVHKIKLLYLPTTPQHSGWAFSVFSIFLYSQYLMNEYSHNMFYLFIYFFTIKDKNRSAICSCYSAYVY